MLSRGRRPSSAAGCARTAGDAGSSPVTGVLGRGRARAPCGGAEMWAPSITRRPPGIDAAVEAPPRRSYLSAHTAHRAYPLLSTETKSALTVLGGPLVRSRAAEERVDELGCSSRARPASPPSAAGRRRARRCGRRSRARPSRAARRRAPTRPVPRELADVLVKHRVRDRAARGSRSARRARRAPARASARGPSRASCARRRSACRRGGSACCRSCGKHVEHVARSAPAPRAACSR